jgi:hypothetical protein
MVFILVVEKIEDEMIWMAKSSVKTNGSASVTKQKYGCAREIIWAVTELSFSLCFA